MRILLIAAAVIVLLFVAGWLTFTRDDNGASINIETETIQEDTAEVVEGGRRAIEGIDDKVDVEIKE